MKTPQCSVCKQEMIRTEAQDSANYKTYACPRGCETAAVRKPTSERQVA